MNMLYKITLFDCVTKKQRMGAILGGIGLERLESIITTISCALVCVAIFLIAAHTVTGWLL